MSMTPEQQANIEALAKKVSDEMFPRPSIKVIFLKIIFSIIKTSFAICLDLVVNIFISKVMLDMYRWFILPVFNNLPNVTLLQMLGLNIFVSLVLYKAVKETMKLTEKLATIIISTLIFWAMGAIIHWMMIHWSHWGLFQ